MQIYTTARDYFPNDIFANSIGTSKYLFTFDSNFVFCNTLGTHGAASQTFYGIAGRAYLHNDFRQW